MADQSRWLKRVCAELVKQGWEYRWGRKHVVFYPADKTKHSFGCSITPSGRYGQENAIRQLEKAGANLNNI